VSARGEGAHTPGEFAANCQHPVLHAVTITVHQLTWPKPVIQSFCQCAQWLRPDAHHCDCLQHARLVRHLPGWPQDRWVGQEHGRAWVCGAAAVVGSFAGGSESVPGVLTQMCCCCSSHTSLAPRLNGRDHHRQGSRLRHRKPHRVALGPLQHGKRAGRAQGLCERQCKVGAVLECALCCDPLVPSHNIAERVSWRGWPALLALDPCGVGGHAPCVWRVTNATCSHEPILFKAWGSGCKARGGARAGGGAGHGVRAWVRVCIKV
jgi:hypothetical protein